jgi:hypothetical protein
MLFLSVFLGVSFPSFFSVISGVDGVATRCVSMVGGFFVLSAVVMLCCLAMMAGGMRMVL